MSGRYLRTFLHEHRSTFDHTRNEKGRSRCYQAVDYDELLLHVKRHRDGGRERLKKVQSLADSAKRSKAEHLLAQHRAVWLATQEHLAQARARAERELCEWRSSLARCDCADSKGFAEELVEMEAAWFAASEGFERDVVGSVRTLRTELRKWTASSQLNRIDAGPNQDVIDELRAVQHQLDAMATVLDHEYQQCWLELQRQGPSLPLFAGFVESGVPIAVRDLAWPNQQSLEAVGEEFLALDGRYKKSLEELDCKFAHILRVRHRKALCVARDIQQREADARVMEAQEEQERKLELLRLTVRVEAPSDPLRLLRETKVSLSRAIGKEEVALQQPLFPVHGYTTEKVMADPRLKLEQALREAGLHNSTYARHIMSTTAPPQPPRRDQLSTVFKYS